jgi:hypothetical protein
MRLLVKPEVLVQNFYRLSARKNAAYISINKITLIIVQHLITNTSGYGAPFLEDGGQKIKYQADVKLRTPVSPNG